MTKAQIKKTWIECLGSIGNGRRGADCVKEFDRFTSDMYGAGRINFDEFLGAQHIIAAGYAAARARRIAAI